MKKILKIVGIILLLLVVFVIAAPFLFKGKIEDLIKKTINNNVNAVVEWEDLDVRFFRSFPDATVTLNNFSVVNKEPFAGDTLAKGDLSITMGIPQLFKGEDDPIQINELLIDEAQITIKVDSLGNANYDIAKTTNQNTSSTTTEVSEEAGFQFTMQHYEINNAVINYLDEKTKTFLKLKEVNHEGTGDFSASISDLETHTEALVSLEFDGVNYLKDNLVKLDADFEMDLDKQRYTFKENEAIINQLPLVFEGWVQINEENNELDLSFKTPSSDFKNFLAVIPEVYAKNLDGVDTTGDFVVNGKIKGVVDDLHIPMLDIAITSNNASFKYPDLPKRVQDISIDAQVKNETGLAEDTYLQLGNLNFRIDQDRFNAKGKIDKLTGNMLVDLTLNGKLNLANLEKAYPLQLEQDLNGLLTVNMTTHFDMESVERERYENIKSTGSATLNDFIYSSPELPKPLTISNAAIQFNTKTITLQQLNGKTGNTDLAATGTIENLIPFLLSKSDLKGNFSLQSKTIGLNDFSVVESENKPTEDTTQKTEGVAKNTAIKIPSFLDAHLDFKADKVIYDNITLANAKGSLEVKDETATLQEISSDLFGGKIALKGDVSTKEVTPTFSMQLDLSAVDIGQTFNGLELFQGLAPIAEALKGAINTTINLSGNLKDDLTPILTSLAGQTIAQILTAEVNPKSTPLLEMLDSKLDFINLKDLDLNGLRTRISFKEGKVEVTPFDFNVKGIHVAVSGEHTFENIINYKVDLDMPGSYLGDKVSSTLANLSETDLNAFTVSLPVMLKGTIKNPKLEIGTEQAVKELTQKIVAAQKEKLKGQGEDKLNDVLGGIFGGKKEDTTQVNTPKGDTSAVKKEDVKEDVKDAVKDVLGGIFGKKNKKDSLNQDN